MMAIARRFLAARWRWLAMLNYQVDPKILLPLVPRGTALDNWQGKTLVSVVGFMFLDTKVLGMPVPGHRNFEEVNLRFYVLRRHPDGDRRGVVFIKEIVPRRMIAAVARGFYNENYVALPMRHSIDLRRGELFDGAGVQYRWRLDDRWHHVKVNVAGKPSRAAADSQEQFITEHYWGYAAQRDGGAVEYQVEHPSWQLWQVSHAELNCDATRLYGPAFADALRGRPDSAFLADGSEVVVRRGRRI